MAIPPEIRLAMEYLEEEMQKEQWRPQSYRIPLRNKLLQKPEKPDTSPPLQGALTVSLTFIGGAFNATQRNHTFTNGLPERLVLTMEEELTPLIGDNYIWDRRTISLVEYHLEPVPSRFTPWAEIPEVVAIYIEPKA